jgi:CheY-like chemotaxis protein
MHGLAGSGASFGFTTLSTTARSLELLLGAIIDQATPPTIEQRMQIDALIAAVRQDGAQPDSATPSRAHPLVRPRPLNDQNYQVFVLDRDRHTVDDLAEQITYYGYTVHTFRDPAELRGAMEHTAPAAIMLEHSVTHHHNTDVAILMEELRAASIPLIFLSARSDLAARLAAVRAGGSAYFTKPVSVGGLIDTLDTLTMQRVPELFRILVIDDEPTLAEYYATVLHQAGMTTEVVTDPLQAFEQLEAFHPDLILMDMYMPGCTGLELAAVIRQQVAYVSVPIVFCRRKPTPNANGQRCTWAATIS